MDGSQGPPGRKGDPGPAGKSECGIRSISGETLCCGEDLSPTFFDGAPSRPAVATLTCRAVALVVVARGRIPCLLVSAGGFDLVSADVVSWHPDVFGHCR